MTKAMQRHGTEDQHPKQKRKQDDAPVDRENPARQERHRASLG
jgi:hypothetical protein